MVYVDLLQDEGSKVLRTIHTLASKEHHSVGDFRIEVTVKSKSLHEAHQLVEDTGFFEPLTGRRLSMDMLLRQA